MQYTMDLVDVSSQEGKGEEDGSDTFATGASNDLKDRKAPEAEH